MAKTLDGPRMRRGLFGLILVLVFGALVGTFIGTSLIGMMMIASAGPFGMASAMATAAVMTTVGLIAVPLWGLFWGAIGLANARRRIKDDMGVKEIDPESSFGRAIHGLAERAGLKTAPMIGFYESGDVNAFAAGSGPNHAMVAFSSGALKTLKPDHLLAIAAHELGHIVNNDMGRMIFARSFQNSLVWFLLFHGLKRTGRWVLTTLSEAVVLGLSRSREYRADAVGAALVGPENMIGALQMLVGVAAKPGWTAKRFDDLMFRSLGTRMFSTHPNLVARISALEAGAYAGAVVWREENASGTAGRMLDQAA